MNVESGFVNLDEFLADLARATDEMETEGPSALEKAVKEVALPAALERVPRRTGRLASSGHVERQGNDVGIVFDAPYGRGAEAGNLGKWSGFRRYGPAGYRFAGGVLESTEDSVIEHLTEDLLPQFGVFGWFR